MKKPLLSVHSLKSFRLVPLRDVCIHHCNIPTVIVKPLSVFKHLVSSPLEDKDTSYYTALSKQSYSYKELLLISAKVISFMVKSEQNTNKKSTHFERHRFPSRNSSFLTDKMTVMLSLRSIEDMTEKFEPYKRHNETPLTTLTRLVDHYERTSKLLPF